ncbi:Phosphatidate phosphatase APP1 [Daejeonella rubra]|uniref:Phosphatidate phosphatase APP1 n=1 Tax=Daejeonella rubra TaxID=990371 RepID=A0A1G9Z1E6_9SPHI|nr:phosphatase domain-containing protein [Daejeonella rubra]SDN15037.1 Phosphatidate phosphatase APP1 [Daejeonella rubra]
MPDWKQYFNSVSSNVEEQFDTLFFNLRKHLKLNDPLQVITYRSYGTINRLYVKGRVLEDKGINSATDKDTIFNNLVNMYNRFQSDEIHGAVLKVRFQDQEHTVITDEEGYFMLNLAPDTPIGAADMWHQIEIELILAPVPFMPGIKSIAEVLVPPSNAEYGIISDIDDTIIHTSATDILAMSRRVFLHNARTRMPFAGVSEFYKALQLGRDGKRNNPFFYVSSSPWNLYDLLKDFLDLNQIPEGPLLLRDFGLQDNKFISSGHMGHKFKEIENILLTYPLLNFVLIGDSGQEDPKIYREIVRKYPERILAIYIRDVQLTDRERIAKDISAELQGHVELVIVDNTLEAAEHAAKTGLIYTEAIPKIEKDKMQDKGEISGKVETMVN